MSKASAYNSGLLSELLDGISEREQAKTDKRMLLAARIEDAIKAKGWKKIDFAREMDKRPSEITKWLSGTHNFNSDTLFDIEEVLGIKLVAIDNKPIEQVTKFHLSVSERIENPSPTGRYSNYYTPQGRSQKGTIISLSDYSNNSQKCHYKHEYARRRDANYI